MTEDTLLWLWLRPDQTCILACPYWLNHCLSLFSSLYFSISPTFRIGNTITTNLPTPCETLWSHRLCAAHGNLFPMIHIYQMTLKCCEFGLLIRLPFFPTLNTICHSEPHTHLLSVILFFPFNESQRGPTEFHQTNREIFIRFGMTEYMTEFSFLGYCFKR